MTKFRKLEAEIEASSRETFKNILFYPGSVFRFKDYRIVFSTLLNMYDELFCENS